MADLKKLYFASDVHLGYPDHAGSLLRERKLVAWLELARQDAHAIFLVGDIFDFWWDWKYVVPRGFTRFLGKLSEIADSGIPIHVFTGNHDVWLFDYLQQECGVTVHYDPIVYVYNGKKLYIGHGDGLGPYDKGYLLLKKCFTSKFLQWCFARVHPNFSMWLGYNWSHNSREKHPYGTFHGEDKEWLVLYSKDLLKKEHYDYFVYGHMHFAIKLSLNENSEYINLGDWLNLFTYGMFDGNEFKLQPFKQL